MNIQAIIDFGLESGADFIEVREEHISGSKIHYYIDGTVDASYGSEKGVGIRIAADGTWCFLSLNCFDEPTIKAVIKSGIRTARNLSVPFYEPEEVSVDAVSFPEKIPAQTLSTEEKIELLKNATALLNPVTWDEPFGLVPVEAQACGTPVVAFDKGAMPEIIKHNKTGFVVKTEKQMIEAIRNIDKINRRDCREWVEQNFTVERMVDEYEKLYRKLVRKK